MEPMELIALAIFIGVYGLIMSERIHRTVAAMVGASLVLLIKIVPWEKVPEYLDLDTILLLAGMMVVVNVARESGLFEYIAIKTAKLSKGSPMKVLLLFSVVTAVVSAFLDNVTTVLLLTPMLLYITKKMGVNPIPFLLSEVFASNIGGTATLIGDPPNIMIGSAANLSFNEFILNMGPIALVDLFATIGIIYLAYRAEMNSHKENEEAIKMTIMSLDERDAIRDPSLFRKSITVLIGVVIGFFFHDKLGVEPAVIALTGASILLLWSRASPEHALEKVEWATLFFFGGLFIIVGSLVETGLITQVANWMVSHIHSEGEAVLIISWFSAFSSAIVDNIPFTATMIPLIKAMGNHMNPYPLWWALSLGACLGGNGTAIGASANVVVIGIAHREGVRITFNDFLKVGMTIMVTTVAIGTAIIWLRYVGL
ncbi:arsenical pump membrane protein [Thermococcus kodakarensis KOD1]|uniref:Arsenical pump membrane protein n=1 Tax=Thermococcus kodakarensis (strain ATCC BAA-918 / JCM 12380 / KOD1) TaxID=69014 RepID=Q5JI40_THEKO|nr:ArsB/NhaD family transporter [Thermococcus kodakarensis]WCN29242.1 ArsB/NhaD family transporter [Thermococcus kodakarensis]WCN31540.1 ArsB/NhaD family transporter [Thermococcus kodakarensis]BAD85069.1 arsenical pump membrane protein [Thermococcus kodakarensis KOD1]